MTNLTIIDAPTAETNVFKVNRLIAVWALSEAALGGVLHAFRIPFTGLFVNSAAVILMVLIAWYSNKPGDVLRATLVVLVIKGIVSPHTPINAYFAVGFQGIAGELLLRSKKYIIPASIMLGVITLLQSALQKIIVLTIVFGNTLWESIDIFGNFVLNQFVADSAVAGDYSLSYWLIALYITIHLAAGIFVGILAARIPVWLTRERENLPFDINLSDVGLSVPKESHGRKRGWLGKTSGIVILLMAMVLVVASYIYPEIPLSQGQKAIVMILRSIVIMFIWFTLLSPVLLKLYRRFLSNKQSSYASEVQQAISIMMPLRRIVYKAWADTGKFPGLKRYRQFIMLALVYILAADIQGEDDD